MNLKLAGLALTSAMMVPVAASQAAVVISGNFCSVAPISNPAPGIDLGGLGGQVASLNTGAGEWFNDFTATGAGGSPVYSAVDTANGAGGTARPGTLHSNMYFNNNAGVPAGVQASWTAVAQDSFDDRSSVTTRQQQLFGGFLQSNFGTIGTSTITLEMTGLNLVNGGNPYDLYVYIDGEDDVATPETGTWEASVGGTTYYGLDNTDFFSNNSGGSPVVGTNTYTQVTSTSNASYQSGNYVKFTGLTGDSFSFTLTSATDGSTKRGVALNAFEVVFVPAPAPLALMALGLLGLGASRRRVQ